MKKSKKNVKNKTEVKEPVDVSKNLGLNITEGVVTNFNYPISGINYNLISTSILPYLNNYSFQLPMAEIPNFSSYLTTYGLIHDKIQELNKENDQIEDQNRRILNELVDDKTENEKLKSEDFKRKIRELERNAKIQERNSRLSYLITRISSSAAQALIENEEKFTKDFLDRTPKKTAVISIDIRRSTELMLKAKSPDDYAEFISGLSQKLQNEITQNNGVFDKFTGDGILGFFPEFFTGDKAIIHALRAAQKCHEIFAQHYRESRKHFSTILKGTGLGIGVDYGDVSIVKINDSLTVVGIPVVYACRFSASPPEKTYVNQSVIDNLSERLKASEYKIIEEEMDLKHEGKAVAYQVIIDLSNSIADNPRWKSL